MSVRSASRLLVVSLFVVLIGFSAEGQRRRAARHSPTTSTPAACHTFTLVRPGLKASYLSTTPNGSATYTITYISDTPTQTKTTQVVSTPQGNANAVTTIDGEVSGILRGMKHIDLTTTLTVPVLGTLTTEVDVDFVPALILGPANGWCVGHTWSVPPVTETVVTRAPFVTPVTSITTTIGGDGVVLAVGEEVTVPAGKFRTVKYRAISFVNDTVQESITWTSMDHSIVVKQDSFDTNGVNVTATVLTKLE
jgi:hypothetical protein